MNWFDSESKPAYVSVAPYGFSLSRSAMAILEDPDYVAIGYDQKRGVLAFAKAPKGFKVTKIPNGGRIACSTVVASLNLSIPKRLKVFLTQEEDMLVADTTPYMQRTSATREASGAEHIDQQQLHRNNMKMNPATLNIIH